MLTIAAIDKAREHFRTVKGHPPRELRLNPEDARRIAGDLTRRIGWSDLHFAPSALVDLETLDWFQDDLVPVGEIHLS